MKSRNSEERAKEVANVNKQLDAGRARRAKAILQRPCRNESLAQAGAMKHNSVQYTIQNRANNETFLHTILMMQTVSQYCANLHSNM